MCVLHGHQQPFLFCRVKQQYVLRRLSNTIVAQQKSTNRDQKYGSTDSSSWLLELKLSDSLNPMAAGDEDMEGGGRGGSCRRFQAG